MKNPLTQAGIEPATFRFVAQHLSHCATAVPRLTGVKNGILARCLFVCVRACARWRGLCAEQRLMPHFSIRCVYLFERAYRTSRTFGEMKRRRRREREAVLCEGIKYDCRYALHYSVCEQRVQDTLHEG